MKDKMSSWFAHALEGYAPEVLGAPKKQEQSAPEVKPEQEVAVVEKEEDSASRKRSASDALECFPKNTFMSPELSRELLQLQLQMLRTERSIAIEKMMDEHLAAESSTSLPSGNA